MFGSALCLGCGTSYGANEWRCPHCLVMKGYRTLHLVSQGGPAQLIRTYRGNHATKAFERDAQTLARVGWIVVSQSAGGFNTFKIGKREPTAISVVYGRPPEPVVPVAPVSPSPQQPS